MNNSLRPNRALLRAAFAVCLAGLAVPLQADIIFSNFGAPGSLYQTGFNGSEAGTVTIGSTGNHLLINAVRFTVPTGIWQVSQVDAAVRNVSGPADAVLLIAVDSSGLPGPFVGSSSFTGIPVENNTCCPLTTWVVPSNTVVLGSAFQPVNYWFVVGPGGATSDLWQWAPSALGPNAFQEDNGPWMDGGALQHEGAFDVLGVNQLAPSAPEPSTLLLLGCGIGALLCAKRAAHK
jgi:hypothetical protein